MPVRARVMMKSHNFFTELSVKSQYFMSANCLGVKYAAALAADCSCRDFLYVPITADMS